MSKPYSITIPLSKAVVALRFPPQSRTLDRIPLRELDVPQLAREPIHRLTSVATNAGLLPLIAKGLTVLAILRFPLVASRSLPEARNAGTDVPAPKFMSETNDRASWLKGGQAQCSIPPKPRTQPPRLILLGAPGVGKGTQAELLCAGMGVCQLSTGDIFRASKCMPEPERSPAMNEALGYMKRGALVPDTTVLNLIRERVRCLNCRGGFLLDGFPRTVPQAEALYDLLEENRVRVEAVLNYTLPITTIVERLSGRRTCASCKSVFHVTGRAPRVAGVCDHCGDKLVQREDDSPEAVEVRMLAYETSTKPLIDYYVGHGLLRTISAEGTPEQIYERTMAILDN